MAKPNINQKIKQPYYTNCDFCREKRKSKSLTYYKGNYLCRSCFKKSAVIISNPRFHPTELLSEKIMFNLHLTKSDYELVVKRINGLNINKSEYLRALVRGDLRTMKGEFA